MEQPKDDKQSESSNEIKPIATTRFFSIEGKKREAPNEFTELGKAIDMFKIEVYKALKIPQIVEWLSKRIS
jgi:hypothetical protein